MLMIKPHDGPKLTADQAQELDDEYFSSRPLNYFSARINSLLQSHDSAGTPGPSTEAFYSGLGLGRGDLLQFEDDDRKLQVAVDALALRHHVAESVLRLLHAISTPSGPDPISIWATITDGPTSLYEVVGLVKARLADDQHLFHKSFFRVGTPSSETVTSLFDSAWAWMARALDLLTDNELTVNAAHNKLKHGLAVRARNDVRVELVQGLVLDEQGNAPVSAFQNGKSTPIFDRPAVTYLARPHPHHKQGLELTSLLIDPPVVLAETWMIAVVYTAMFHVAASAHFGDREADVAPYPTLHLGPTPETLLNGRFRGYRGVLTTPLRPEVQARQSGLFVNANDFVPITIDFDTVVQTTIIDA
ncbi:MAG: hypothetical protein ABWX92_15235 [Mycetocola sp.]